MGYTQEQLLSHLQELQVSFSQYEHPVVLTVEAQAKYVGHMKGALSKNLFLKDKKQRFYIVSSLAETKVDLKVLSQRLGLGKGGVRMAPEESLAEILQVPLGCVTPFALVNESARNVSLLLDQGFKSHDCCFFHPLSDDMSIAVNARDLDKFLNSIGKFPAYVDLEANPADQYPDLASLVPTDATVLNDPPQSKPSSYDGPETKHFSVNNQPIPVAKAKAAKLSNVSTKEKSPAPIDQSISFADPDKFVDEILEKTKSIFLSEVSKMLQSSPLISETSNSSLIISTNPVKGENIEKYHTQLGLELKNIATMFKNAAYTEGFKAGIQHQPKRM